jgi:excisionase family DNA binding protein
MARKPANDRDTSGGLISKPRYFSIRDVAHCFDVSTRTVRRWNKAGVLPVHRIGNLIRISEADLENFLTRSREAE